MRVMKGLIDCGSAVQEEPGMFPPEGYLLLPCRVLCLLCYCWVGGGLVFAFPGSFLLCSVQVEWQPLMN